MLKWIHVVLRAVSRMDSWHSRACASVQTKKVKNKWGAAGEKYMKYIINTLTQHIHIKENVMLLTENKVRKFAINGKTCHMSTSA